MFKRKRAKQTSHSLSSYILGKGKRKKETSIVIQESEGLSFLSTFSGYTAVDYRWSEQFASYMDNFDQELNKSINTLGLDSYNPAFNDSEIDAMLAFERKIMNTQKIEHEKTIEQIKSQITSRIQMLTGQIEQIKYAQELLNGGKEDEE